MSSLKQDQTISHLKRIRGQVDGLIRMYEEERACIDIVRQITAVRNSLSRVLRDMLTKEASQCHHSNNTEKLDKILQELLKY